MTDAIKVLGQVDVDATTTTVLYTTPEPNSDNRSSLGFVTEAQPVEPLG
jgi:hypothetical protein